MAYVEPQKWQDRTLWNETQLSLPTALGGALTPKSAARFLGARFPMMRKKRIASQMETFEQKYFEDPGAGVDSTNIALVYNRVGDRALASARHAGAFGALQAFPNYSPPRWDPTNVDAHMLSKLVAGYYGQPSPELERWKRIFPDKPTELDYATASRALLKFNTVCHRDVAQFGKRYLSSWPPPESIMSRHVASTGPPPLNAENPYFHPPGSHPQSTVPNPRYGTECNDGSTSYNGDSGCASGVALEEGQTPVLNGGTIALITTAAVCLIGVLVVTMQ